MQGTPTSPGLIPLAIEEAFNHIAGASQEREYALRVSYLEGIREVSVASVGDVFDTIVEGEARRAVGETEFNSRSSRSHAILRLTIESSARRGAGDRRAADLSVLTSTLSFVDLAGSERCPEASAPARVKEGAYINKSLHLCRKQPAPLALVVSKLSAGATKADHVPYRDSKLTRLLRPALGGKARVALVCTASLAASAAEETAHTLKFAQRAKKVVQRGSDTRDSVVDTSSLLAHYRAQIDALKADLALASETSARSARERLATDAERSPNPKAQFFSERKWRGAKGRRAAASPGTVEPLPPPPPPEEASSPPDAMVSSLLGIKQAIEKLDKAEAENERLQAELARATDILAAREAELLAAKGLDSPEDETF
ncbi:hypothetical protein JL721_1962 [Aureococcus anophagefferens]|nr:hypothetical protein JL721_1962 [Aureococcus anophagefferens]